MKPLIVVAIAVSVLAGACSYKREVVEQRPATVTATPATVVVPADPPASATVVVPAR